MAIARTALSKALDAIQVVKAFLLHFMNLDEKLVFRLHCKNCQLPMLLDALTMGRALKSVIGRTHVACVCPECRHVRIYGLFRDTTDHNPKDKHMLARLRKQTVFLRLLSCADCRTKLPLFALWSATTTEEERKADMSTWRWDGLHCPQGHKIEAPPR